MRIWSIHPKYLDAKGLLAVWRETLLAKKVLEGKTKGYKNHPQLLRFKQQKKPLNAINTYLQGIEKEAKTRGYAFDKQKIGKSSTKKKIFVTRGQLVYEFKHLKRKVKKRAQKKYIEIKGIKQILAHPLFKERKGEKECWEK